ncbi:MAG: M20/M25/M40 family metallo-hydrolase [Defluviitaleaceae bacterium]|nr:M20/M25/M40 family metallo-hydrolase [Defluviitaleaceae bacterium]
MNSIQLLKDLTDAFGPSGFEEAVNDAAMPYVPAGYEAKRDSMMNLYLRKKGDAKLPTVLIDAHSDEIGLMVQAVRANGTMTFLPLGGWVPATLSGQRMRIRNRDGAYVTGIIAAKMHHFGGGNEGPPSLEGMSIDIGANSKEEVEKVYKIFPGCPVVPHSDFEQQGDRLIAKAFDDRLGCAAVLETLDAFKKKKLGVNLIGAFSSQEEVGIRGAKTVANTVKPDLVICFEGAPADDTLVEASQIQTRLGGGPMLRHIDGGMITNPRLIEFTRKVAAKAKIDVQEAVRARGSTNGSWYHHANQGTPTLVISCPTRYAHSHHSMISLADYQACVKLAVAVVGALDAKVIGGF